MKESHIDMILDAAVGLFFGLYLRELVYQLGAGLSYFGSATGVVVCGVYLIGRYVQITRRKDLS